MATGVARGTRQYHSVEALQLYREGSADFADCLHIALATEAGEQLL